MDMFCKHCRKLHEELEEEGFATVGCTRTRGTITDDTCAIHNRSGGDVEEIIDGFSAVFKRSRKDLPKELDLILKLFDHLVEAPSDKMGRQWRSKEIEGYIVEVLKTLCKSHELSAHKLGLGPLAWDECEHWDELKTLPENLQKPVLRPLDEVLTTMIESLRKQGLFQTQVQGFAWECRRCERDQHEAPGPGYFKTKPVRWQCQECGPVFRLVDRWGDEEEDEIDKARETAREAAFGAKYEAEMKRGREAPSTFEEALRKGRSTKDASLFAIVNALLGAGISAEDASAFASYIVNKGDSDPECPKILAHIEGDPECQEILARVEKKLGFKISL